MTHPSSPAPPPGPGRALTTEQRIDNYRRQTGARELTPRQRRRVTHKANHAVASGSA